MQEGWDKAVETVLGEYLQAVCVDDIEPVTESISRLKSGRVTVLQSGGSPAEGFAYYSRRATLAGVLTATLLCWLGDQSENSAATWAFLDRRIEDVMRIGRLRSRIDGWAARLTGARPSAAGG